MPEPASTKEQGTERMTALSIEIHVVRVSEEVPRLQAESCYFAACAVSAAHRLSVRRLIMERHLAVANEVAAGRRECVGKGRIHLVTRRSPNRS